MADASDIIAMIRYYLERINEEQQEKLRLDAANRMFSFMAKNPHAWKNKPRLVITIKLKLLKFLTDKFFEDKRSYVFKWSREMGIAL